MGRWVFVQDKEVGLMPDYEDLILQRQEMDEIWEDGGELDLETVLYADDLYEGVVIVDEHILT